MPTATESPTLIWDIDQVDLPSTLAETDQEQATVAPIRPLLFFLLEGTHLPVRFKYGSQPPENITMTDDGGTLLPDQVNNLTCKLVQLYQHDQTYSIWQSGARLSRFFSLLTGGVEAQISPARIIDGSLAKSVKQPHLQAIQWIKETTGFSQERIAELLGISRQTLNRWDRGEPIKDANRRRVFAVREVLERAVLKHPSRAELVEWLDTPRGADGVTPAQLLTRGEVNRARLLAISVPSGKLQRPPAWIKRQVPAAFRAGAEHPQTAVPPELDHDLLQLLDVNGISRDE